MNTSAQGLRVLVTAGAAGIGRAIAQTFAAHGARVHVCDVAQAALDACGREQPGISRSLADVARIEDVERLFADVKRQLGGLDVLVNNAGISGPTAKVEDIQPADWERCIAVARASRPTAGRRRIRKCSCSSCPRSGPRRTWWSTSLPAARRP